jgi:lipoprotein-releasing system ATP-binding protein
MENIIRITGLKKSYTTEAGALDVLKGIDMEVERGVIAAVVGASGAGKSTLLHVMGTLDRPTAGSVFYDGRDVFKYDDRALAAFRNGSIGFVFQFHHLLAEFTAMENVMMPGLIQGAGRGKKTRAELEERAARLLGDLGLSHRLRHRPGELSGGEQQRVAVARALIMEPVVVLADEPTGNLDTNTSMELFDLLTKINENKHTTFIIVTHNEQLSARCQKIYEMVDGRFIPDAGHAG